jgi:hypothetical protein
MDYRDLTLGPNVPGTVIPARLFVNIGIDIELRWLHYSQYGMQLSTMGTIIRGCWLKLIRIMIAIKGDVQKHADAHALPVPCWYTHQVDTVCQVYSTIFLYFLQPLFAVAQLDFPLSPSTNTRLLATIEQILVALYPEYVEETPHRKPKRTTRQGQPRGVAKTERAVITQATTSSSHLPKSEHSVIDVLGMARYFWADQWLFGDCFMHLATYNVAPIKYTTTTQRILQEMCQHILLEYDDWDKLVVCIPSFSCYSRPGLVSQPVQFSLPINDIAQMGRITYLYGLYNLVHSRGYNTSVNTVQQIASLYRTFVRIAK